MKEWQEKNRRKIGDRKRLQPLQPLQLQHPLQPKVPKNKKRTKVVSLTH
ncbi:MAG: hypothetical protein J6Z41_02005 [Prevotella sp.]|nr:hypothetical protein [Prevotella sp.]